MTTLLDKSRRVYLLSDHASDHFPRFPSRVDLDEGRDRNLKRALRATLARFHSMPLVLACSCSPTIGSWTATRSGQRAMSPSRSEGNRTRRWRMAGVLSSRKSVGRLSAVAAEASTWSLDCSLCAQRRSRSDPAWSIRYQRWLSRHSSAARAPILRCQPAQRRS